MGGSRAVIAAVRKSKTKNVHTTAFFFFFCSFLLPLIFFSSRIRSFTRRQTSNLLGAKNTMDFVRFSDMLFLVSDEINKKNKKNLLARCRHDNVNEDPRHTSAPDWAILNRSQTREHAKWHGGTLLTILASWHWPVLPGISRFFPSFIEIWDFWILFLSHLPGIFRPISSRNFRINLLVVFWGSLTLVPQVFFFFFFLLCSCKNSSWKKQNKQQICL